MEFVKAHLHMDRMKCQVNTQITLEEDKNISDRNPDAAAILMEKGNIVLEEVRTGKDQVTMKGKLFYEVLYLSDEEESVLYRLQGEIPFEEKVRAEGVDSMDTAQVKTKIEDLRIGLINSRKISVRALVDFCIKAEELFDESIPVEIQGTERLEVKKESFSQSVLSVDRKDIFRIKEELELPASMPPVQEVLWKSLELGKWEIRALEDNIGIQGEIRVFLLYEGEAEERPVKAYETIVPFSGNLECIGSRSGMITEITPSVNSWNINIKEDYDGEARQLEAEMVLDLPIHLLEQKEWEMITDVYGITQEIVPVYGNGTGKRMQDKYQGKVKISQVMTIPASSPHILQIYHAENTVLLEDVEKVKTGLEIEGIVPVTVLYMSDNERKPYESLRGEIPFSYTLESGNLTENSSWNITPSIEQCSAILLDNENVEVKVVIGLEITIMEKWQQPFLRSVQIQPLQPEKLNQMPGMVVYISNGGEHIWEIGKRYLVPIESIRSLNELNSDEVVKGQKILIVKEAG